jgi:hypothetical protein
MVGGDLNPHFFDWGSLTLYLFALCFSVAAWIQGHVAPSGPLTIRDYYILGCVIVMIAGSLTIVVLFRLNCLEGRTSGIGQLFESLQILGYCNGLYGRRSG